MGVLGRLTRAVAACPVCDAPTARADRWCGACGANLLDRAEVAVTGTEERSEAPAGDEGRDGRARRVVAAALVTALGVAGLVVATRPPPGEALLGRLDVATRVTSTRPPPTGLRLAWTWEDPGAGTADDGLGIGRPAVPVGDGERVLLGNDVVDVASGEVVGRLPFPFDARLGVVVAQDTLHEVDPLRGTIGAGVPIVGLPDEWDGVRPSGVRAGDVVVVEGPWDAARGHVPYALVGLDGRVRGVLDGADGAVEAGLEQDRFVLQERWSVDGGLAGGGTLAQVVDVATGATVLVLPVPDGAVQQDAVLVGDRVVVASTREQLGVARPEPPTWELEVFELDGAGTPSWSGEVGSSDVPSVLGLLRDGRVAVALAARNEVDVVAVGDGALDVVAAGLTTAAPRGYGAGTGSVAVVDGLLVVAGREDVTARDAAGEELWRRSGSGSVERIDVGDGLLVVHERDAAGTGRLVALRADGTEVAAVDAPSEAFEGARAVAVLGDAVAVGRVPVDPYGGGRDDDLLHAHTPLLRLAWRDLRRGEEVDAVQVFAPHLRADTGDVWDVGRGAQRFALLGVGVGPDGVPYPVLLRERPAGPIEVLGPSGAFERVFTRPPTAEAASFEPFVEPLAVTAETVALQTFDAGSGRPAVTLVDRVTGEQVTDDGLSGVRQVGSVLLLGREDEAGAADLAVVDLATRTEAWHAPGVRAFGTTFGPGDEELLVELRPEGVHAYDVRDGTTAWAASLGELQLATAVLTARHVVVLGSFGRVVALDRGTGDVAWDADLDGVPTGAVAGAGEDVLVGTVNGDVVHLDAAGRVVQRLATVTGPVEQVVATPDAVLVVSGSRVAAWRADGRGVDAGDEVQLP